MATVDSVTRLIEPAIVGLGYELVGVEYRPNQRGSLLRIYIDKQGGVGVDDCALVSQQVSGVLDVEDPIPGQYNLEVSSPGLDRPVFKPGDYDRFAGARIRVRMSGLYEGRRKITGVLVGLREGAVVIDEDGVEHRVPLERIEKANLLLEP